MITLVTGGAGFIGSAVVDRLLDAGHVVHVVDDFSSGSHANLAQAKANHGERLTIHELDIRDPALIDLIAQVVPEVICHLAAQIDVRVSVADPVRDATINVIGSLHVLEGARKASTRKVVFASSGGTIYGEPDASVLPVDETHPQRPVSPYGVAKKAVSDYLFAYQQLHGLDFTSLALANVYGPRQDPHGEAGVVAIFAGRLLDGQPCRIFGSGDQTRDFVFVDDVADAFVRATEPGRASGLVVNIGTGVETSVNELYAAMAEAAGVDAEAIHEPPRPGELARNALATDLAEKELGWRPTTDLRAGAHATLDWFRAQRA
ncbi:MAG TPA: NAD-dependent epimerase/dehydratase family protein [Acidimicrobiales bacterium]